MEDSLNNTQFYPQKGDKGFTPLALIHFYPNFKYLDFVSLWPILIFSVLWLYIYSYIYIIITIKKIP